MRAASARVASSAMVLSSVVRERRSEESTAPESPPMATSRSRDRTVTSISEKPSRWRRLPRSARTRCFPTMDRPPSGRKRVSGAGFAEDEASGEKRLPHAGLPPTEVLGATSLVDSSCPGLAPMSCSFPVRRPSRSAVVVLALAASACSGGGGGGGGVPPVNVGAEVPKPGGGTFFVDHHHEGRASRLHLVECTWGRLVDVHALDSTGTVDPLPVFRDMLIAESVQSDSLDYNLESNPITQRTRLVILRQRGAPDSGSGAFEALLARARTLLPPILPKPDDGSVGGPFSFLARNACVSLRFDDLLADGPEELLALRETVRILTGYPPSTPFVTRIRFDPNHGGIA